MDMFKTELNILRDCDHPNVIRFYESYEDKNYIHFVIDYCSGGDLVSEIIEQNFLGEEYTKRIFFQVLCAMNAIQARGVFHRDIKADNFLFTDKKKNDIKLIDFGLAAKFTEKDKEQKFTEILGTHQYVAPEVIDQCYDQRSDYWSAGVMLYVMLFGIFPCDFDTNKNMKDQFGAFKQTLKKGIKYPTHINISDQAKSLIERFLQADPAKRLTINDA